MEKKKAKAGPLTGIAKGVVVPLRIYARTKLTSLADAYEGCARRLQKEAEKDGTLSADMAYLGAKVAEVKKQGFDSFLSVTRGDTPSYDSGRNTVLDMVNGSARETWLKQPKEYLRLEGEVWREQWDNLMSDLWRMARSQFYIWHTLHRRFPQDDAFAMAKLELSSDVMREHDVRMDDWVRMYAKRSRAQPPPPAAKPPPSAADGAQDSVLGDLKGMAEARERIVAKYTKALDDVIGDKAARHWAAAFGSELYMIGGKKAMKQLAAAQLVRDVYENKLGKGSFATVQSVNKLRSEISKRTNNAKK